MRISFPSTTKLRIFEADHSDGEELLQLPEFGRSCREEGAGLVVAVEDVMVEMEGRTRRIGGDLTKCMAGIRGQYSGWQVVCLLNFDDKILKVCCVQLE